MYKYVGASAKECRFFSPVDFEGSLFCTFSFVAKVSAVLYAV